MGPAGGKSGGEGRVELAPGCPLCAPLTLSTPPVTSECPARNFVAEVMLMSAPSACGRADGPPQSASGALTDEPRPSKVRRRRRLG